MLTYVNIFSGESMIAMSCVVFDVDRDQLVSHALHHEEALLTVDGALVVRTGTRTGRSVRDRYIVVDMNTRDNIAWGKNSQPFSTMQMERIWQKALSYQRSVRCFGSKLQVGASERYALEVTAITEYAWHQLFLQNLFIKNIQSSYSDHAKWTLLSLPNMKLEPEQDAVNSDAAVFIDFTNKRVVLCGLKYAGEMKKAMFSVLNYLLPVRGVLPMHCAANVGASGDTALFFGLSGTGKTTLSADPKRKLVGDDEHGWSSEEVFNFEGGCYAKCINLTEKNEPLIWHATKSDTAVLENVMLKDGIVDFTDASLTSNTRAAYSRDVLSGCVKANKAATPEAVVFLTCDLYGVLPPVSLLEHDQAVFWFLNGYTALVGSTEVGSTKQIQPTFSTCFGAAFFPRNPQIYAELLKSLLATSSAKVYLVNTGWTGGVCGSGGSRFSIHTTRKIIDCIHNKSVAQASKQVLTAFRLAVPTQLPGIDSKLLDPRTTWSDQAMYDQYHDRLYKACMHNFQKNYVSTDY